MSFSSAFFAAVEPTSDGPDPDTFMSERHSSISHDDRSETARASQRHSSVSAASNDDDNMAKSVTGEDDGAPHKPQAAKKKKGTATVVKNTKRSRPGSTTGPGVKKSKGTKRKPGSSSTTNINMAGLGLNDNPGLVEDDGGGGTGGGASSESDSGPYCLCRGPDNHRFMIACDGCEDWFHGECIGMDKWDGENLVQRYICPNCTDNKTYVTRYKKMCTLDGCRNPARIYDLQNPSNFCSAEHTQEFWEQWVATLPRTKGVSFDLLTQQEFMALLAPPDRKPGEKGKSWRVGEKPFGVPHDFWEHVNPADVLTSEEQSLLHKSAEDRHDFTQEIATCKKMLQLMEWAVKRREAAIAAGKGTAKDLCGYDERLDTVGVRFPFEAFLETPEGKTIFKAGRLDAPLPPSGEDEASSKSETAGNDKAENTDPLTAGMCLKKKCKPHAHWPSILSKNVKHIMKELTIQTREKLNTEERIKDSAASRYRRNSRENNSVVVFDSSESEDSDEEMGGAV